MYNLGYKYWILIVVSAVVQQFSVVGRFISFKYATPSKLSHYTYLGSFYAFIFDLIEKTPFSAFEYGGIGLILTGFAGKFIVVGKRLRTAKEAEKKKFKAAVEI